jgi:oligosaccharyltransferase complex subunit epsilon
LAVWDRYVQDTPQRVKLIDVFMTFLILVGVLQFLYCVIGGNYVRSTPLVAFPISD